MFWQSRTPIPTQSSAQPDISMSGGACVVISGTVYGPGARSTLAAPRAVAVAAATLSPRSSSSCLTSISGNNNFYFAYQKDYFASPYVYGLVE